MKLQRFGLFKDRKIFSSNFSFPTVFLNSKSSFALCWRNSETKLFMYHENFCNF